MIGLLPENIAVVVLGPGGAALGRRLRTALAGARLHGPRAHPGDWDESYDRVSTHIGMLFEAGQPIVGICASGILIRSVAPFLAAKQEEPAVVAVAEDGSVENRILQIPAGLPPSALCEAGNFLSARIRGRTLQEVKCEIEASRKLAEAELGELTARLVDAGLASWADSPAHGPQLIVRGQANLLQDLTAIEDLERIRLLFADLETKKDVIELLSRAEGGDGVRIFIGSENKLFSLSGSSMIAAPFHDREQRIVGVLGVIGPTRLNYARIVPMVDFTSKAVARLLQSR